MKKIKEMLIVFMFIISVSAVAAPQGHPLSDIWDNSYPFTFGELLIASGGISTTTITANGAVNAGSIEVGSVTLNSATLDMGTGKITNLGVPTVDTDAATVGYVNDKVSSVITSQWTKTPNYLYYTDTNVGIGTTAPTAMLEIKSVKDGIGIVVDTRSQIDDWKYGLIIKATRNNTKAFAVINGTSDKFVVYGDGNANINDLRVKSITVGNHNEGGGYTSTHANWNKDTETCNTVYTICDDGYIAVGVIMTRHPNCGAMAVPICAKN